jgi:hypothetical protein
MKKLLLGLLISSLLLSYALFSVSVMVAVSVGVNAGDWIEYTASYTGSPADYYVDWMRIDVKNVQDSDVTVDMMGAFLNGINDTESGTFDLEVGLPGAMIVPANLDVGDQFYHEDYGNITIEETDEIISVGSKRTAVYATVTQAEMHWDKETGVLLQSEMSMNNFTLNMVVTKTNIWQTQSDGLELTVVVILLITLIVAVTAVFLLRKKRLNR